MIFFRYIWHSWPRFPPVTRLFSFNPKHGLLWPAPTPHRQIHSEGPLKCFSRLDQGLIKQRQSGSILNSPPSKLPCRLPRNEWKRSEKSSSTLVFFHLPKKKKLVWTRFLSPGIRPHPDFTYRWQHLVKVTYKLQECDQSHKRAPPEAPKARRITMISKLHTMFRSSSTALVTFIKI